MMTMMIMVVKIFVKLMSTARNRTTRAEYVERWIVQAADTACDRIGGDLTIAAKMCDAIDMMSSDRFGLTSGR